MFQRFALLFMCIFRYICTSGLGVIKNRHRHRMLSVCACVYDIQGGMYMLVLLDTYAPTYAVLVIALFECIAVAWVYGSYT